MELAAFFQRQLDYIFFVYGFAGIVLAVICLMLRNEKPQSRLLLSLAAFAGFQGLSQWGHVLDTAFMLGNTLQRVELLLAGVSLLALLIFVRQGLQQWRQLELPFWWLVPFLTLLYPEPGVTSYWLQAGISLLAGAAAVWLIKEQAKTVAYGLRTELRAVAIWLAVYMAGYSAGAAETGLLLYSSGQPFTVSVYFYLWQMVTFVGLTIAFWLYVQAHGQQERRARQGNLRTSSAYVVVAVMLVLLGSGWLVTELFGRDYANGAKTQLLERTLAASTLIEPDRVEQMVTSAPIISKEEYAVLQRQLLAIENTQPDCRFAYLIAQKKSNLFFLVDSEQPDSPDYVQPWTLYNSNIPVVNKVFLSGNPAVSEPYHDQWGEWVSGFAPIRDSKSGQVVAVLGIDIPSDRFQQQAANMRFLAIAGVFFICMFLVVLFLLLEMTRQSTAHTLTSQRSFKALFTNAPEAILIFDLHTRQIIAANPFAVAWLGYTEKELQLLRFDDLVEATPADIEDNIERAQREGCAVVPNRAFRKKDGSRAYAEVNGTWFEFDNQAAYLVLTRDTTARKIAEDNLYKLSQALTQSPLMVLMTDPQGMIEYVNQKFVELTGYQAEDALGRPVHMLAVATESLDGQQALWQSLENGQEWRGELCSRRQDGSLYWEQVTSAPIRDAEGQIVQFLIMKQDITERKRVEGELQKAKVAAEEAHRAKNQFLANMSHEIRTPMNGVIGMTEMLLETPLNEEQYEYANIVRESAGSLLSIVNDILDMSKMEAGKLTLEMHEMDVRHFVQKTVDLISWKAAEKQLDLIIEVDPGVPERICGDSVRLSQVLLNLVNNAIKFTEAGSIRLQVMPDASLLPLALRFAVVDTGIGISPEHSAVIFQSFSQVDPSNTRKHGGTGLGLTIAKQLVELMGGTIGVDSQLGYGSTFWFVIPFHCSQEGYCGQPHEAMPLIDAVIPAMQDKHILVAEDHISNQRLMVRVLEKLGYRVTVVGNGEEVLDAVQQMHYDLVFMDCQMPIMDGFAATQAIRRREMAEPTGPHLPIVALTAKAMQGDREKCMAAGMDDYLSKPVNIEQLRQTLEKWVYVAGDTTAGKKREADLLMEETLDRNVLEELRELQPDEPQFLNELIDSYLEQMDVLLTNCKQAEDGQNLTELRRATHSIKSVSASMGAMRLSAMGKQMEKWAAEGQWEGKPYSLEALEEEFTAVKAALQDYAGK